MNRSYFSPLNLCCSLMPVHASVPSYGCTAVGCSWAHRLYGSSQALQRASLIASLAHFGDKLAVSWSRLCEQTVQSAWTDISTVSRSSCAILVDLQHLNIWTYLLWELVCGSKPAKSLSLLLGYRQAGIVSWKCVSMLMWLCAFAPLSWSRSADNLTLAARLDCEWVSPHCVVWVFWAQLQPALEYSTLLITRCFG